MDIYEKKYKEALELARDYYKANQKLGESEENEVLSDIFPELKESEDERIRKFLIQMAQNGHGENKDWLNKCVSWLEKQGEQNIIKIAKFKSGDTIEFNGFGHNRYTIKEVCGTTHYINSDGRRMDMSYTDANFEVVKDSDNVEPKFKVGDTM